MSLANPELALNKTHEFLAVLTPLEGDSVISDSELATAKLRGMLPLMRDIAERVRPELVEELETPHSDVWNDYGYQTVGWSLVQRAAETLVGALKDWRVREQILGPAGPALAAEGLHPWIWHATVDLWADGHFKHAVNGAAAKVEEQTQLKLDREDLSGTNLYREAFRLDTKPGERRLRFMHLTELTADGNRTESWKSAHQGAMNFGQGCAQGIRNMNAHGTGDLAEEEALEYLAALSVLARWVDTAQVIKGDSDPGPF